MSGIEVSEKELRTLVRCEQPIVLCYGVGGIGDHILRLPAINALASLFPGRLRVVCETFIAESLLYGLRDAQVYGFEFRASQGELEFNAAELARRLGSCDLLLALNSNCGPLSLELIRLLKPAHSIGFFETFDEYVEYDASKHVAELAFRMPLCMNPQLDIQQFAFVDTLPYYKKQALDLLSSFEPKQKILAIHAETKVHKIWRFDRLQKVVDKFLDQHPEYVVLTLGTSDAKLDGGRHPDRVISCHGVSFQLTVAIMSYIDLFLGYDSCLLHVADLKRIPSVGLFGETDPQTWGFYFTQHIHVRTSSRSMDSIDVETVSNALEEMSMKRNALSEAL